MAFGENEAAAAGAGGAGAADGGAVEQRAFTGTLPGWDAVEEHVAAAHARSRRQTHGSVADYIPILAAADPELFGVCVAEVDGAVHTAGDAEAEFSIQSISKAFVYALSARSSAMRSCASGSG